LKLIFRLFENTQLQDYELSCTYKEERPARLQVFRTTSSQISWLQT
jgi:hypothetical protein